MQISSSSVRNSKKLSKLWQVVRYMFLKADLTPSPVFLFISSNSSRLPVQFVFQDSTRTEQEKKTRKPKARATKQKTKPARSTKMPGKTLVVLGSGPGIGVAIAQTFSVRGFTHIALVARNSERLKEDQDKVYDAIQERGYSCQVKTWTCDMSDLDALKKTLGEIETFGGLECVLFNAARVAGKPPLEEDIMAIESDFRVGFYFPL